MKFKNAEMFSDVNLIKKKQNYILFIIIPSKVSRVSQVVLNNVIKILSCDDVKIIL